MILKQEEQGRFKVLLRYLHEHDKEVYRIRNSNEVINAYYDTDYESTMAWKWMKKVMKNTTA